MQFFTTLLSALVLAVSTTATPVRIAERAKLIVYGPPITSPQGGDTWFVGSKQVVSWDTTNMPPAAANYTGTIYLGYHEDGSISEHLDISELFECFGCHRTHTRVENPLATGFLLSTGYQSVTVPYVVPRDRYIVARKSTAQILRRS